METPAEERLTKIRKLAMERPENEQVVNEFCQPGYFPSSDSFVFVDQNQQIQQQNNVVGKQRIQSSSSNNSNNSSNLSSSSFFDFPVSSSLLIDNNQFNSISNGNNFQTNNDFGAGVADFQIGAQQSFNIVPLRNSTTNIYVG